MMTIFAFISFNIANFINNSPPWYRDSAAGVSASIESKRGVDEAEYVCHTEAGIPSFLPNFQQLTVP